MIETLYSGCKALDRTAQKQLYQLLAPTMYGLCLRYAPSPEDAEEMLQEGFIKVFTRLSQFRGEGSFEGWIRRIMVRTAIEYLRKTRRLVPAADLEELGEDELPAASTFEPMVHEELLGLIAGLPEGYRLVFNMFVIEGYSHKEIAALLGISEGTSKSQLLRARHCLQRQLIKLEGKHDDTTTASGG